MDPFHVVTRYEELNVRLRFQYAILKALDNGAIDESTGKILQEKEKDIQFVGREISDILYEVDQIICESHKKTGYDEKLFGCDSIKTFYRMMDIHPDHDEEIARIRMADKERLDWSHIITEDEVIEIKEKLKNGISRVFQWKEIDEPTEKLLLEKIEEIPIVGVEAFSLMCQLFKIAEENLKTTGFLYHEDRKLNSFNITHFSHAIEFLKWENDERDF